MSAQHLYSTKPTKEEYEQRCLDIAALEAQTIEWVFGRYDVNARIDDEICVFNQQYFAFAVETLGGKRGGVNDVLAKENELSNAISRLRGRRTKVRIQELPLTIEVPNPWRRSLMYTEARLRVGAHRMLAGIEYDAYSGKQPLVFDLADEHKHILIGGASNSGKSVLQNMMVLSLATSTSPVNLRMVLVDLKGRDLPKYATLPHVADVATEIADAETMIDNVHAEVMWRKSHFTPTLPRLVLVIDELAELRNSSAAVNKLNSILALGRGLNVHCMLATQYPTKETLGGLRLDNVSVRISGNVSDANTASRVTGRPGTGAHLLPLKSGAFIAVAGPDVRRFQAYLLPDEPAADKAAHVTELWTEELAERGESIPPAFNAPVMADNQRRQRPVTTGYRNQQSPVITSYSGVSGSNVPVFDAVERAAPSPVTPVMFPLGAFRELMEDERNEVRRMATLDEYQHNGSPSRNRLVVAVYGSKSPERLQEIDRALNSAEETKVIRLPQRAAR